MFASSSFKSLAFFSSRFFFFFSSFFRFCPFLITDVGITGGVTAFSILTKSTTGSSIVGFGGDVYTSFFSMGFFRPPIFFVCYKSLVGFQMLAYILSRNHLYEKSIAGKALQKDIELQTYLF